MRSKRSLRWIAAMVTLLAGCTTARQYPAPPPQSVEQIVEIDGKRFTELHVDGSLTACVFLQPAMLGIGPDGGLPSGASPQSIHVIVAGKLHQTAAPTNGGLFSIAGESISTVLQAKTEDELTRLFMLARYVNANFKVAGIPQDCPLSGNCMSFDPQVMRGLFDVGYRAGKNGTAWRSIPPGIELERLSIAKTGTRFVTTGKTNLPESWMPEKLRISLGTEDATDRR